MDLGGGGGGGVALVLSFLPLALTRGAKIVYIINHYDI